MKPIGTKGAIVWTETSAWSPYNSIKGTDINKIYLAAHKYYKGAYQSLP